MTSYVVQGSIFEGTLQKPHPSIVLAYMRTALACLANSLSMDELKAGMESKVILEESCDQRSCDFLIPC